MRLLEDKRTQDCAPRCTARCPAHVDARTLLAAIGRGDVSTALETFMRAVPFHGIISHVCDRPCCDAETAQGDPFAVYMYGVFMAEVAVGMATGKTTVEGITAISDIGKINNKLVVDGQMYGGIGLDLSEDFEDIKAHSTMRGAGIPMAKDIPDKIDLCYIETPREYGPFGAAGVGELPLTSPHVTIVNSIRNATSVRITHVPRGPRRSWQGSRS